MPISIPESPLMNLIKKHLSFFIYLVFFQSGSALAYEWPPVKGKVFPNLELVNQDGKKMKLEELRGKVLLVEVVGMTCPACNAWSGAGKRGKFNSIEPQGGLDSIEKYLKDYGGLELSDRRLVFVQLLLYNLAMKAPTADDAKNWAKHFGFQTSNQQYVFAGREDLINSASYNMIPGFFLVDKDFVLRSDSTSHNPKESLYTDLLPMISKLF
jgi:hypothetical protein